jgi:hypothetical protein
MAEITYLMGSDAGGSGFYTDAAAYFSARPDPILGLTGGGEPTTLDDVFTDLRTRATAGESFEVINVVVEPTAAAGLSFPISAAHPGSITQTTLEAALSNAGGAGYPAIPGAPAVTEDTTLCLYGPDVGTDTAFVTRLAMLFGPELTVCTPLHPQDFADGQPIAVDDESQFRKTIISSELAPSDHSFPPPEPEEPTMALLYGKYRATVVDAADPMSNGRLQVDVPSAGVSGSWAEASLPPIPASLVQLPPSGATIWVEFEEGDVNKPLWTGVLWGTDLGEDVTLASQGNLTLSAKKSIEMAADMSLDASAGMNVSVTGGAAASVTAGTTMELNAAAVMNLVAAARMGVSATQVGVTSPMSTFSGVLQADSLITTSVVSSSYTPGAGNIW